ncbi:MAG TPA: hypothetical protein VH682_23005 [Gemmataceae bacterium]|jgi:hypothetical protein
MTTPKFALGSLVATPAALKAIADSGQAPLDFLSRHAAGDWGDVDAEDWKLNDEAVTAGERILSAYKTKAGERIWIITEADRSSTCILLPDEY